MSQQSNTILSPHGCHISFFKLAITLTVTGKVDKQKQVDKTLLNFFPTIHANLDSAVEIRETDKVKVVGHSRINLTVHYERAETPQGAHKALKPHPKTIYAVSMDASHGNL